jgi:hypothetical protein
MASVFDALRGLNNGQSIALAWDNTAGLKDFTALVGTDGLNFLPVNDRGRYMPGVIQPLTTGGQYYTGLPVVEIVHPWISDGQIETLMTYQGNCTLRHHISQSVGKLDTQISNVVFNLDLTQLAGLQRIENGYQGFISRFVVVEVLS